MGSHYNNLNNNNNNNNYLNPTKPRAVDGVAAAASADFGQHFNLSDNGLHNFFNSLKLLTLKCGPASPPPRVTPISAAFQNSISAASDSVLYSEPNIQQNLYLQQQQFEHYHQYQLQQQKQQKQRKIIRQTFNSNALSSQRHRNSPPELIHNMPPPPQHKHSTTISNNNNNNSIGQHQQNSTHLQQQQQSDKQQQQPQSEHQQSCDKSDAYIDQHYQHYYSYYYNRQPAVHSGSIKPSTVIAADNKPKSRKLPPTIHRMAAANHKNNLIALEEACAKVERDNAIFSQTFHYNGGVGGGKNVSAATTTAATDAAHVLREKLLPNNNLMLNGYNHDDKWLQQHEMDEVELVKDFDVKEIADYDDKLIMPNNYDAHFNALLKTKTKRSNRLLGGASLPTDIDYRTAETQHQNNNHAVAVSPEDAAAPAQRRGAMKLPATPKHKKGVLPKKPSPPAPRVLLYNSSSPRANTRHLPRLSPISSRMREFRRRTQSNNSLDIIESKTKHLYSNPLMEHDKTNSDISFKFESNNRPLTLVQKNALKHIKERHITKNKSDAAANNSDDDDSVDDADNNKDSDTEDDDYDDDLDNDSDFDDCCESGLASSDSDDGYRTYAFKLTQPLDKFVAGTDSAVSTSSEESIANPDSILVPSLFPNVPPYLSFSSNTAKGPEVHPDLYRILKWRVTNVTPKVVRIVLANSGVRLLKKTNDWMGTWGKHMKSPCFKTIRPHQKINHLPGSFRIGRKDACWKNLQKQMAKHGRRDFGFMPKTFIIPHDLNQLRHSWPKYAQRRTKWIIKPPASARGAGIRVVDRWEQIPKRKPLIVQKYIERPLLINGSKFDLRLYVLVTSMNPLRVYMYHNGLARFASVKYSDKSDTLHDRCMHLTNYSINKFSSNYSKNEDVNACHGHKWTIKSLWSYLGNRGVRTDLLWDALRNLVLRTIISGEQSINNMVKMNVESKYSCFELFGFDVLLDSELIPWLLEVNISPSLHSELPLDSHVKAPLVRSVLNTALYNVPPKLSQEKQQEISMRMSLPDGPLCFDKRMYINYLSRQEKIKHNTFTRKTIEDREEYVDSILENLTPDDVRCLIIAEDELARSSPLERIFPTTRTYKYLKYTETPRYYNRLLDAWENRYGNNRNEGIAKLRKLCDMKYHLEVPPLPVKKHPTCRTRALMVMNRIKSTLALTTAAKSIQRRNRVLRQKMLLMQQLKNMAQQPNDNEDEEDDVECQDYVLSSEDEVNDAVIQKINV